jgi:bifunctional NMN adenylyltransferase/nudix hydrolase
MVNKVDFVVFICRAQPYHLGHQANILKALSLANKRVIVLIGSSGAARNIKNPFTFEERKEMIINDPYVNSSTTHLTVLPLQDFKYNNLAWIAQVQEKVKAAIEQGMHGWSDFPPTVGIIGLDKDESTEYLNWFPQWQMLEVDHFGNENGFDATLVRKLLFSGADTKFIKGALPESTFKVIVDNVDKWQPLKEEFAFIEKYKEAWASAPYAPTFVTTDAVVFQAGHVLLIKRGAMPGKGQWALPGGFLNPNEQILDGAIRELREETRLKVPEPVLRGSIIGEKVFDYPGRSLRGRTITHAFGFKLNELGKLPVVKGSDDAAKAKWVSLVDIKPEEMFEDHMDIINYFKGLL